MSKKPRLGRNMNALLGGATRNRREEASAAPEAATTSPTASPATPDSLSNALPSSPDAASEPVSSVDAEPVSTDADEAAVNPDVAADTPPAPHLRSVSSMPAAAAPSVISDADVLMQIGVDQIRRGSWQPRRNFDQELLQELADSLKAQGMIQPVLVRPFANGAYELIAGERRWRAAQLAGMQEIPALIRDMEDQRVAAVSLIENIQRKDLNPLEEAQAFERLCDEFGMTHKAVAESVGRSRASVSNLMRLLELHDEVKVMVDKGLLEMGHARALLGVSTEQQPELARRVVDQGLTVRAIEKLIRDQQSGTPARGTSRSDRVSDPDIDRLSRKLGELLGTSVEIRHKTSGSGRLEISYTSVSELEGILEHIK